MVNLKRRLINRNLRRYTLRLNDAQEFGEQKNLRTAPSGRRYLLQPRLLRVLVAPMNPCPCDFHANPTRECTCSLGRVLSYHQRISGPLLDRIDIHLDVPRVPFQNLAALEKGEPSADIRARVERARAVQHERFATLGKPGMLVNGDMGPAAVQAFCAVDEAGTHLLRTAMQQMNLSTRAYHRVLKLGRTIADLAGEATVQVHHLAEALQYRPRTVA